MNREIEFRGKRKDTNEWIYGYYHKEVSTSHTLQEYGINEMTIHYIHTVLNHLPYKIPIIPETIGQYTGLKDKNGKKIFEGDRIRASWVPAFNLVVVFTDGSFYLKKDDGRHISFAEVIERTKGSVQGTIEVIGNIYEKNDK